MSALRSSAGPAVEMNATPSSRRRSGRGVVLPRPGGPESSTWSSASPRAAAAAIETPSCSLSASWPTNSSSRRGRSVASSSSSARSCGVWTRSMPGVRIIGARALQRVGDQVLGRVAGRAVEQLLGLLRREAEPDEAVARQQPRVVAARDDDRVVGRRGADLLAQLDDDPLRGALADRPGRPAAARCRRPRRRRAARAACRPRAPPARPSGPTDCTPISIRKRSRSASVAKP